MPQVGNGKYHGPGVTCASLHCIPQLAASCLNVQVSASSQLIGKVEAGFLGGQAVKAK